MEPEEHLTPDELVARWKDAVTVATLGQWRVKGCGPGYIKFGRRVLYPISQVRAWEDARVQQNTQQRPGA